jgi:Domain of unknown function (DU1801)
MAKNKTTETEHSVTDFMNSVTDEKKRMDSFQIIEMINSLTSLVPKMWGPSIVGFGSYHYKYESGHEGDAPLIGLSPRKNAITIYLAPNFINKAELLKLLGKHTTGKGCLYINNLEDVDIEVLKEMIAASLDHMKQHYQATY